MEDLQDILTDTTWFEKWLRIPAARAVAFKIPSSAYAISTLLSLPAWMDMLASHPNHQQLVHFFLEGISNGFQLGFYHGQFTLKSTGRNLPAAIGHPDIVIEYLQHESL